MSKTPRSDAEIKKIPLKGVFGVARLCEELEIELEQARAEIERLKEKLRVEITENLEHLGNIRWYEEMELPKKNKLIEQMREIINDYRIEHKAWCNHDPDNAKECTCGLSEKVKAALSAAERGE